MNESEKVYRDSHERKELVKYLDNLYIQKDTYSVPWIHGAITVKVLTYPLSNLVNYSYEVRRGNDLIEKNASNNPDIVIERIEYFTNLEV